MIDWPRILELARTLPGVEPGYSYGSPALKLRNKLIARLREDGETLVLRADVAERHVLIASAPEKFSSSRRTTRPIRGSSCACHGSTPTSYVSC